VKEFRDGCHFWRGAIHGCFSHDDPSVPTPRTSHARQPAPTEACSINSKPSTPKPYTPHATPYTLNP